ncbi:MAG: 2-iminoacetate synthase ThiH, partial [Candidatus Eiseniibacteriota bacterium]
MSFREHLAAAPVGELLETAHGASPRDVERALSMDAPDPRSFAALLSPAADSHLEELARRARDVTLRRFGRTVQLYAPL